MAGRIGLEESRAERDTAAAPAPCPDRPIPPPSPRAAALPLLLRAATVAPAGILPAHLLLAPGAARNFCPLTSTQTRGCLLVLATTATGEERTSGAAVSGPVAGTASS